MAGAGGYRACLPDSRAGKREAVHLRFVESPAAAGWHALTTHGWNATELVVQDLDALAARLGSSGDFRLIAHPAA